MNGATLPMNEVATPRNKGATPRSKGATTRSKAPQMGGNSVVRVAMKSGQKVGLNKTESEEARKVDQSLTSREVLVAKEISRIDV